MPNRESLPLISIVMPVHNGAETLERAIRSVVAQTFRDWELLAVDDGSSDESANILWRCAAEDGRIRPFRLDENRGAERRAQLGDAKRSRADRQLPRPRRRVLPRLPGVGSASIATRAMS